MKPTKQALKDAMLVVPMVGDGESYRQRLLDVATEKVLHKPKPKSLLRRALVPLCGECGGSDESGYLTYCILLDGHEGPHEFDVPNTTRPNKPRGSA